MLNDINNWKFSLNLKLYKFIKKYYYKTVYNKSMYYNLLGDKTLNKLKNKKIKIITPNKSNTINKN